MNYLYLVVLTFLFVACKKENIQPEQTETVLYENLRVTAVEVTSIPNANYQGEFWDDDQTPADISVTLRDQTSSVLWVAPNYLPNSETGVFIPENPILIGSPNNESTFVQVIIRDYDSPTSSPVIGDNRHYPHEKNGKITSIVTSQGIQTKLTYEWY